MSREATFREYYMTPQAVLLMYHARLLARLAACRANNQGVKQEQTRLVHASATASYVAGLDVAGLG
jgi:hypothetical protein